MDQQFDIDDLDRFVTEEARAAMLDLVLRWASLDGAVSQLYASVFDKIDERDADEISDIPVSTKLRRIQVAMRPHNPEWAANFGKLKRQSERYRQERDTVAHCHLAGMLKSRPDYLVFLRYRRHSSGGLAVEAISIEGLGRSTRFAEHLRSVVERLDKLIREWPRPGGA